MRKIVIILAIMGILFGGLACVSEGETLPEVLWYESLAVYGAEQSSSVEVEGNIMAVFYVKSTGQVTFWVTDANIVDRGDGKWDVTSPQLQAGGVNQALVAYGLYQYQGIERIYNEEGFELPLYLDDLDLQPITADDLPKSEHIGKLTAVNVNLAKPATVTRKYMGVTYDVQCLVTQAVVNMWIADDLNIGDFVLVSFIEEVPNTTEIDVAIVTDKVYESW